MSTIAQKTAVFIRPLPPLGPAKPQAIQVSSARGPALSRLAHALQAEKPNGMRSAAKYVKAFIFKITCTIQRAFARSAWTN